MQRDCYANFSELRMLVTRVQMWIRTWIRMMQWYLELELRWGLKTSPRCFRMIEIVRIIRSPCKIIVIDVKVLPIFSFHNFLIKKKKLKPKFDYYLWKFVASCVTVNLDNSIVSIRSHRACARGLVCTAENINCTQLTMVYRYFANVIL